MKYTVVKHRQFLLEMSNKPYSIHEVIQLILSTLSPSSKMQYKKYL